MAIETNLQRLKDDFAFFLAAIWKVQGLPYPSPLQLDMARAMQYGNPRQQIWALRGAGKTYMSCAFALWSLYNDPDFNVLIVSATGSKAEDFSHLIRRWIDSVPFLKPLNPRVKDSTARDRINKFDVGTKTDTRPTASASVSSYGITGQVTGGRANLILADDIETQDNSLTVHLKLRLRNKVKEFESILHPGGRILYLGTPQNTDSIYTALHSEGYSATTWPALYPDLKDNNAELTSDWMKKMVSNDPSLIGTSTFPERFSFEDLMERRAAVGETYFRLQYLLDTSLSDAEKYPLKLKDLIIFNPSEDKAPAALVWSSGRQNARDDLPCCGFIGDHWTEASFKDDLWIPFQEIVMYIDPSGSGRDELGYCIGKLLNGSIYLFSSGGLPVGTSTEAFDHLCHQAWKHNVQKVLVESNFGGGMYSQLLRPALDGYYKQNYTDSGQLKVIPEIEDDRVSRQKELRIIDTLEPVFNQHRLVVLEEVARDNELWYQVTHITRDRGCLEKDDRVDALSGLCAYFTDKLSVNQMEMRQKANQRAWEEELARDAKLHRFSSLGKAPRGPKTFFKV